MRKKGVAKARGSDEERDIAEGQRLVLAHAQRTFERRIAREASQKYSTARDAVYEPLLTHLIDIIQLRWPSPQDLLGIVYSHSDWYSPSGGVLEASACLELEVWKLLGATRPVLAVDLSSPVVCLASIVMIVRGDDRKDKGISKQ